MAGGEGREGDWECNGCRNRNYAFRSFCNRCKQPRLLVDSHTPPDSKWLPRIGDWICSGCTNNNYASREKCKKCGQPKEVAAMPAIAAFPTYAPYYARGAADQKMTFGLAGSFGFQQHLPHGSSWPMGGANSWSLAGTHISGLPFTSPVAQPVSIPKGWRNGDWICHCGFHNYSSRTQCKNCSASVPPAIGTKRLASEEPGSDWENKRLNVGNENEQQRTQSEVVRIGGTSSDSTAGVYASYPSISLGVNSNLPSLIQFQTTPPALLGKGAKHWRQGDWMCTTCNNHNYASRSQCNKCKMERDAVAQPVSLAVGAV